MDNPVSLRSLARGLEALEFIINRDGARFIEVQEATGLPKAVVHRILGQLVQSGFVWRGLAEQKYFAAPHIAAPSWPWARLLLRAAREPLAELVGQVLWPSDLFVLNGSQMILIDTSQSMSPFGLHSAMIGQRVPLLLSSVGRAALAAMPVAAREDTIAELRRSGELRRQARYLSGSVEEIVADVQRRGVAVREPNYPGVQMERRGTSIIASALVCGEQVVGAFNLWWPGSADSERQFVQRHTPAVQRTAATISRTLAELTQSMTRPPSGQD